MNLRGRTPRCHTGDRGLKDIRKAKSINFIVSFTGELCIMACVSCSPKSLSLGRRSARAFCDGLAVALHPTHVRSSVHVRPPCLQLVQCFPDVWVCLALGGSLGLGSSSSDWRQRPKVNDRSSMCPAAAAAAAAVPPNSSLFLLPTASSLPIAQPRRGMPPLRDEENGCSAGRGSAAALPRAWRRRDCAIITCPGGDARSRHAQGRKAWGRCELASGHLAVSAHCHRCPAWGCSRRSIQ